MLVMPHVVDLAGQSRQRCLDIDDSFVSLAVQVADIGLAGPECLTSSLGVARTSVALQVALRPTQPCLAPSRSEFDSELLGVIPVIFSSALSC